MTYSEIAVLETLGRICEKHGKRYCFPTQETLCALLDKNQHITITRRGLNKVLARLEAAGMIRRRRRRKRAPSGELIFRSTLYQLTAKSVFFIASLCRSMRKLLNLFRVNSSSQNESLHSAHHYRKPKNEAPRSYLADLTWDVLESWTPEDEERWRRLAYGT